MSAPRLSVRITTAHSGRYLTHAPVVFRHSAGAGKSVSNVDAGMAYLDDVFADVIHENSDWRGSLVDRLSSASSDGRVTYVVPGHPALGDATVQYLLSLHEARALVVEVDDAPIPSWLADRMLRGTGATAFVDVLSLLDLSRQRPFAGGTYPLHSGQSTIITNVAGKEQCIALLSILSRRFNSDSIVELQSMLDDGERVASTHLDALTRLVDGLWCLVIPAAEEQTFQRSSDDLQRLVAHLRAPGGCPWDREQTNHSLTRNLIEESYELLDAIESGDATAMKEELGDFLLQAFLHSQIAEEDGNFTLEDVVSALIEKLVRRHPHVFASDTAADSEAVTRNWDEIKREERSSKGVSGVESPLGEIPASLPALLRAQTVLKRASRASISEDVIRRRRDSAVESLASDGRRAELLNELIVAVESASEAGIDLEALLRDWTRAFETSIANGFEIESTR